MTACTLPKLRTPNSIHTALHEHETAEDDFATWPQVVQNIHVRELNRWAARNPELDIVEQNHSIDPGRRICVTEFHYAPRAPAPAPNQAVAP